MAPPSRAALALSAVRSVLPSSVAATFFASAPIQLITIFSTMATTPSSTLFHICSSNCCHVWVPWSILRVPWTQSSTMPLVPVVQALTVASMDRWSSVSRRRFPSASALVIAAWRMANWLASSARASLYCLVALSLDAMMMSSALVRAAAMSSAAFFSRVTSEAMSASIRALAVA